MNEKAKNRLFTVLAFLAGVVITVVIIFAIKGNLSFRKSREDSTKKTAESTQLSSGSGEELNYTETYPSWNPDSESLRELVSFVSDTTDKKSSGYLEPADRIAVFDMDGTILCEKAPVYIDYCLTMYRVLDDPSYEATDEERSAMQQVRDHAYTYGETFKPEGITKDDLVASAFAGMTPEEFRAYTVNFADNNEVVGFSGMTYGQSFYKPMIEVIDYLRANDFDVWMVSACEREVVRALVERFDIPYDHVIATDVPYYTSELGDDIADNYNMDSDESILLGAPLDEVECAKSGKSAAIAREIGKRPVLAFGNSSGDFSMLNYAEGNPDHAGMGFFIVCDDTEREYGSEEKASEFYEEVEKQSWTAISMAKDWKTIYGEGVQKTGLPGTESSLSEAA
ncbi:MAG: haloacid dehalogenase-like hydrolase [Clostridia bacterium]|nr:haloacid dehalogenase-like hydrolase [Clostridia bacterium]